MTYLSNTFRSSIEHVCAYIFKCHFDIDFYSENFCDNIVTQWIRYIMAHVHTRASIWINYLLSMSFSLNLKYWLCLRSSTHLFPGLGFAGLFFLYTPLVSCIIIFVDLFFRVFRPALFFRASRDTTAPHSAYCPKPSWSSGQDSWPLASRPGFDSRWW